MYKSKLFIFLLLFNLLAININANKINNTIDINYSEICLLRNGYDFDSKSIKGWIRIFNSKEKLEEYGIKVNKIERKIILVELKNKYKKFSNKYKREVK